MADAERPNVLGRVWQRGMSGWTGHWALTLEDGSHIVSIVLKMGLTGNRLTVWADGQKIESAAIFAFLGEIRRFRWHGHEFALRVKGFGLSGELALLMDGTELRPDGAAPVAVAPQTAVPVSNVAQGPTTPQLRREIDALEADEVMAIEEFKPQG